MNSRLRSPSNRSQGGYLCPRLISDFRYAIRSLLKNPGLTRRRRPVARPRDRRQHHHLHVGAGGAVPAHPGRRGPGDAFASRRWRTAKAQSRSWSYPNYKDFRDRTTLMDVVAQDDQTLSIAVDDTAERAWGALVSGNYFEVMGLRSGGGPAVHAAG